MFQKLKLSTKILIVLLPPFFLAVAAIVYFSYASQEAASFEQAQVAATVQAMTIRESLVDQMVSNYSVDPDFLTRVSRAADLADLDIWFLTDSLKLKEEYLTPRRLTRLRQTELRGDQREHGNALEVYSTGEPLWLLTCRLGEHDDAPIGDISPNHPKFLNACEELKAVVPFKAETKCQECHAVRVGSVLGAAQMVLPLSKTTAAIRASAVRSITIYVLTSVLAVLLGVVVFRRFVASPLSTLVRATESIGDGKLDASIAPGFGGDEFGLLARAFDEMQVRLREAQRELLHKERLSTVGQMASTIIHDLRSPMTGVTLGVDRLQHGDRMNDEERAKVFKLVKGSIERINRMLQELLDFSRGHVRLDYAECNVEELVGRIVQLAELDMQVKGIRFTCDNQFQGTALIDMDRLQRAIMNILSNAEDATPAGGEIHLGISSDDGLLQFRIRDTGPGIPEEIRGRIFEPFATFGKARGTGLGLAITQRVVEEHFGEIAFESERGRGTTFTIKIPLKPPFDKRSAA